MAFDESISEYLSLDCTLRVFFMYAWILCCDIDMIDHLDLGLRMLLFLYFIAILVWYIDMSIIIGCSPCFAWYGDSVSS